MVNMPGFDHEMVKEEILSIIKGQIGRKDLAKIHSSLSGENQAVQDEFWKNLVNFKIINSEGKVLAENFPEEKFAFIENSSIKLETKSFFRSLANRRRVIPIPRHLHGFVESHLDSFLDNAVIATHLQRDVHYVVDIDRNKQRADLNLLVTIIDKDTGTDQTNSKWDDGLHQFIQLKEGCKISPMMLKAVFVSNITFIKNYSIINGVTGTLGSEVEKDFLKEMFNTNFMFVPTAYRQQLRSNHVTRVVESEQDWENEIVTDVMSAIPTRSVVVFAKSIRDAHKISSSIAARLGPEVASDCLHTYCRDYEDFEFESAELEQGHVIVATNLAGRGTDIKLSSNVRENGGLHVLLTYLPDNFRIEEQAYGRAGSI